MSAYIFKTGDVGVTRDGKPYRVLATDLQGSHPLAAAISFGEDEYAREFTAAGTRYKMFLSGEDLLPPKGDK